jgi:hypothetical protein
VYSFVHVEQQVNIKFCITLGKTAAEIHKMLETVCENGAVSSSGLKKRLVRTLKMAYSMYGYQMLEIQNTCKIL